MQKYEGGEGLQAKAVGVWPPAGFVYATPCPATLTLSAFALDWTEMAPRRLLPFGIVESLNVIEHVVPVRVFAKTCVAPCLSFGFIHMLTPYD